MPDMGDDAPAAAAGAGAATEAADGEHPGTQSPPPASRSCLTNTVGDGTGRAPRDILVGRPADAAGNRAGDRTGLET